MAKDFKNSIGRKRLNTLIPDADPAPLVETVEEATSPAVKKQFKRGAQVTPPTLPETVVSTFRINTDKLKTIKAIAFWDRKKIQDVFDEALGQYIASQPKATIDKAVEEYTKRTE